MIHKTAQPMQDDIPPAVKWIGAGLLALGAGTGLLGLAHRHYYKKAVDTDNLAAASESTAGELMDLADARKLIQDTVPGTYVMSTPRDRYLFAKLFGRDYVDGYMADTLWRTVGGKKVPVMKLLAIPTAAATSGKVNGAIIRHELGHLQRPVHNVWQETPGKWERFKDMWRGCIHPTQSDVYREEKAAWDLAGVPESSPSRKAGLAGYEAYSRWRLLHWLYTGNDPDLRYTKQASVSDLRTELAKMYGDRANEYMLWTPDGELPAKQMVPWIAVYGQNAGPGFDGQIDLLMSEQGKPIAYGFNGERMRSSWNDVSADALAKAKLISIMHRDFAALRNLKGLQPLVDDTGSIDA